MEGGMKGGREVGREGGRGRERERDGEKPMNLENKKLNALIPNKEKV